MTNWIAANLVTWMFDISRLQEPGREHQVRLHLQDHLQRRGHRPSWAWTCCSPAPRSTAASWWPLSSPSLMYILMNKTTLGYELKACGANRHAARYAGIRDKRNIVLSMAIAGCAGRRRRCAVLAVRQHGVLLVHLSVPARRGLQRHPRGPAGTRTTPSPWCLPACFMSMLDIVGLQLTNLTAYNEYITDVIIAVIVYLSAFSLVIRMMLSRQKKPHAHVEETAAPAADAAPAEEPAEEPTEPAEPIAAQTEEGGDAGMTFLIQQTPDLCGAPDDRGPGRRVRRAQRYHQPGAGRYHDLRRLHRRAVRAADAAAPRRC